MHIISRKKLLDFSTKHSEAYTPLDIWYRNVKSKHYKSLIDIQNDYPHADYVNGKTIFNISGNHYRLITVIHYNIKRIYIRDILTHAEYDKGNWK